MICLSAVGAYRHPHESIGRASTACLCNESASRAALAGRLIQPEREWKITNRQTNNSPSEKRDDTDKQHPSWTWSRKVPLSRRNSVLRDPFMKVTHKRERSVRKVVRSFMVVVGWGFSPAGIVSECAVLIRVQCRASNLFFDPTSFV